MFLVTVYSEVCFSQTWLKISRKTDSCAKTLTSLCKSAEKKIIRLLKFLILKYKTFFHLRMPEVLALIRVFDCDTFQLHKIEIILSPT